jgi:small-conductance mechanosensitive channel
VYTTENYVWGLVAYVLGVLMLMPLLWWATRRLLWHPIKAFFRLLVITFLLTPTFPYQDMNHLAPAWVVGVFEIIKPQTSAGVWRGVLPITICFIVIYTIYIGLWLKFHKPRGR